MQLFDPLHFVIGVGPLAVYLLLIGILNYSRKPFLTTGSRDISALGVAISGLMIVGPMELFMPPAAADRFAGWVWLLLLIFYGLCVSLSILLMRPRLVIYNVSVDQLRPILMKVVHDIDKDGRWAGDSLIVPNLQIQLHVEPSSVLRNVQLVSSGPKQSLEGWLKLEERLNEALQPIQSLRNPVGLGMMIIAGLIGLTCTVWMLSSPAAVAQSLNEMLRL
ncbi:MAG: hypothetical protein P8M80_00690 [Pirellulaceae bacterium]|nr:hypothetical protein [Pirellulaceae bacterium]